MRKTIYKDRYIVGTVYNLKETKEYKHHTGYHSVFIEGKYRTVSRVAFKGEIAKSLEIEDIPGNIFNKKDLTV